MAFGFGKPDVETLERKRDVKQLIKALSYKKDAGVREDAAIALGEIGDARAVEPLIKALSDSNENVRENAADTLGEIGDARAAESLIRMRDDPDSDVRQNVKHALAKLGG